MGSYVLGVYIIDGVWVGKLHVRVEYPDQRPIGEAGPASITEDLSDKLWAPETHMSAFLAWICAGPPVLTHSPPQCTGVNG